MHVILQAEHERVQSQLFELKEQKEAASNVVMSAAELAAEEQETLGLRVRSQPLCLPAPSPALMESDIARMARQKGLECILTINMHVAVSVCNPLTSVCVWTPGLWSWRGVCWKSALLFSWPDPRIVAARQQLLRTPSHRGPPMPYGL